LASLDLYSPPDLHDALKFIEQHEKGVTVLASGTDLLPRLRKKQLAPSVLLDISPFQQELRYVRESEGFVRLGALTTLTDLLESPLFIGKLSVVHEAAALFGAPQIRNVATVGGNLCSAASSEDLIPVFLALDAKVRLVSARGERSVPLREFLIDKRSTVLKPSEILSEVYFTSPQEHSWTGFEKLGRRNMLIISIVNEALFLGLEEDLHTIKTARLALNRVSGRVPALAEKTSRFLEGKTVSDETVLGAQRVLASELKLASDFRASGEYREKIALVYLKRLLRRCVEKIEEAR
jgi:carbon-monoxide dehydrogenase medium subunit